jgi:hypothetical protein
MTGDSKEQQLAKAKNLQVVLGREQDALTTQYQYMNKKLLARLGQQRAAASGGAGESAPPNPTPTPTPSPTPTPKQTQAKQPAHPYNNPVHVTSQEEYDGLASGDYYTDGAGVLKKKP